MAVGKGSMARASKAAAKSMEIKPETAVNTAEKTAETKKVPERAATRKPASLKTAAKRTAEKTVKEAMVENSVVITGTSEEVMQHIVYQKSAQVLDREPEDNETFGIGEAMPIYLF